MNTAENDNPIYTDDGNVPDAISFTTPPKIVPAAPQNPPVPATPSQPPHATTPAIQNANTPTPVVNQPPAATMPVANPTPPPFKPVVPQRLNITAPLPSEIRPSKLPLISVILVTILIITAIPTYFYIDGHRQTKKFDNNLTSNVISLVNPDSTFGKHSIPSNKLSLMAPSEIKDQTYSINQNCVENTDIYFGSNLEDLASKVSSRKISLDDSKLIYVQAIRYKNSIKKCTNSNKQVRNFQPKLSFFTSEIHDKSVKAHISNATFNGEPAQIAYIPVPESSTITYAFGQTHKDAYYLITLSVSCEDSLIREQYTKKLFGQILSSIEYTD